MTENNNGQDRPPCVLSTMTEQRITDLESSSNGPPPADPTPAAPAPALSNVERAEQITDQMAEKCSSAASACVRSLAWLTARAREAAEDLWAEAQSVRNREQR